MSSEILVCANHCKWKHKMKTICCERNQFLLYEWYFQPICKIVTKLNQWPNKRDQCLLTLARRDSRDSNIWSSSELSISSNIPVILPDSSECMAWIRGKRRSPSICFCSWGGAAARVDEVRGSWPWMWIACGGTWLADWRCQVMHTSTLL